MTKTDGKKSQATAAALASAKNTLSLEIDGLKALADSLNASFADAIETIIAAKGRIIVTGMGKSGHIARKIAATMASTGTPAQFVHPGEASHGDLGMITTNDVILALSWSGESAELQSIITYAKRFSIPLISMTSNADSTLGQAATVPLILPKSEEACDAVSAPTTSTTMQLALGDALAVALIEKRGFTASDFHVFHPGGKLGAGLRHVSDIMHKEKDLPLVAMGTSMGDAIYVMSDKRLGCIGVVDASGALKGLVTDGDLRRHMNKDLLQKTVNDIMNPSPKTVPPTMLVSEALNVLNTKRITSLFVVDKGKPVGVVHIHDFLKAGVA
ncbi:MAG: KpsF/GutQ family sugar-phosphate isomerase [Parvibaculum sp.]|nr:KpsF/GutQ family sugar-phosphate isomerase [Parvibaculum sp.]